MKKKTEQDELRPEYALEKLRIVERGPGRSRQGRTITLDPDVAIMFPTSEAVNQALRRVIRKAKPGHPATGS